MVFIWYTGIPKKYGKLGFVAEYTMLSVERFRDNLRLGRNLGVHVCS